MTTITPYAFMWILLSSYIIFTCKNSDLKAVVIPHSEVSASNLGDHILVFEKHYCPISYVPSEQENYTINVIVLSKIFLFK